MLTFTKASDGGTCVAVTMMKTFALAE